MKKIETTLATVKNDITAFYKPELHHFMVMNAVEVGDKIEVQWFFSDYAFPCETTCFFTLIDPAEKIPSIKDIVVSAWVAEAVPQALVQAGRGPAWSEPGTAGRRPSRDIGSAFPPRAHARTGSSRR